MNFCGGGVEHQVHEPPIVSLVPPHMQTSFDTDDLLHQDQNGPHYHHHQNIDLPVHPSCIVTSSQPQNSRRSSTSITSSTNKATTGILKMSKKKFQRSLTPTRTRSVNINTNNNTTSTNTNTTKTTYTPPRSRSRSRSRSRGTARKKTLEESMSGMEIVTPSRPTTNTNTSTHVIATTTNTCSTPSNINLASSSAKSSPMPSPRLLNPLSPQRIASVAAANITTTTVATNNNNTNTAAAATESNTIMGLPSFANMKTLDTLLKRLENGFRVTIHNGSDPAGKRVFLTLLQNRTSLMIRPITVEGDDGTTPTIKFPVRTILRLEIGKTKSSVLGRSIYDHVHPMTCFSIVVKLWTDEETYFDFEASSVIEREALISTLMVVLDQMHNNNSSSSNNNNHSGIATGVLPISFESKSINSTGPAWLHPRKGAYSPSSTAAAPAIEIKLDDTDNKKPVELPAEICLSPGKRTKIYSNTFFDDTADGEEQQGTEISLVYPNLQLEEESGVRSPRSHGTTTGNTNKGKPLRQRQLQPAAVDTSSGDVLPNPCSPPRTTRMRISPRDSMIGGGSSSSSSKLNPFQNIVKVSGMKSPHSTTSSPLKTPRIEVERYAVDSPETTPKSHQDEQRDTTSEEGGIVILDTDLEATEIEIGLNSPEGDIQSDLSFDIVQQRLPVSKIQFSPTRDAYDPQTGCCSLAPINMDQMNGACGGGGGGVNHQAAWCSDDICTLALKDIAETCTGIFDHQSFARDLNGNSSDYKGGTGLKGDQAAAERAFVEEYIAGVLGGPNSALGAFFPDGDVWNVDSSKQPASRNGKLRANRIRNRASLLNAQAIRLRTLRNEMTFAAALKRSKEKMQYVQTTKSFDDADSERIRQAQEKSVSRLHTSALMERVMGSMVLSKTKTEDEAVYYDSDPEDVRPRTRGVRRALANRRNAVEKNEEEKYQSRPVLSGVGFERIAIGKKLRKLDEGLIVQIVQAMRNETMTLMWHPTQSEELPNRSPVCVNLWIESGVYLVDGSFLLPRLSWSVAYENDLGAKKLNVSKAEPDQIDLLDVCRIRVPEKIDRKLHPFPDPRKSFMIETQDEVYLFEAQTADERNRIVYGYKLVIARLASLLMLRDSRAVEEFFGSASAMVPGGFTVGK